MVIFRILDQKRNSKSVSGADFYEDFKNVGLDFLSQPQLCPGMGERISKIYFAKFEIFEFKTSILNLEVSNF